MRANVPFSQKPQKASSAYIHLEQDRPSLPLTRFSEKSNTRNGHNKVMSAQELKGRALRENIQTQGLARMLQKVPRKPE